MNMSRKEMLKKVVSDFYSDEAGQSTTEYILMLSAVVMIAIKFKTTFSTKITKIVESLSGQIEGAASEQ